MKVSSLSSTVREFQKNYPCSRINNIQGRLANHGLDEEQGEYIYIFFIPGKYSLDNDGLELRC